MSSTVALNVQPDPELLALPPSRPERFQRSDFIAAAIVYATTFLVYLLTMAPNVTLEDSGELITGAAKFGVPHPPGYPLWTMSGFLISHLVPLGNLAWRINLESAIFGAAANAVLALLVCHSGRWLVQRWVAPEHLPAVRQFCFYAGMFAGITLGFSDVMWSQAVIAEVYTLNALFVNLVLLLFYFWMLDPAKTHRLVITVFVFALGLTNHHTLIQMIPAILVASACIRGGQFASVLTAVNLFSLSILVYLSWLSGDADMQTISYRMAIGILALTALLSLFYLESFRPKLFLLGLGIAFAVLAYGALVMTPSPEDWITARIHHEPLHSWLQIETGYGMVLALLLIVALGFLFSSKLNRWLIVGVFAAGWVGLTPYAYESFASSTHPPMNWGYASERAGFFYAVSREQYPMSLPDLIKHQIGRLVGMKNIPRDTALDRPNYWHRQMLNFYYYGDNLQDNFTVPLICLSLAVLVYVRRCDSPQMQWFIFLLVAFVVLGFMLHLIEPPESFDFERNLQYKVFHLQSHCIFVLFMGYGAIAAMTYLYETTHEYTQRIGPALALGMPALYLALLPLWSNFDDGNQARHWFGYAYGHDIMAPMDRDAVYFGGSDAGRFVPTYMAFVESQQSSAWKQDPGFDRRDVAVITQNAVCDTYYCQYIRDQYDNRFRKKPDQYTPFEKWLGRATAYPPTETICLSTPELAACWNTFENRADVRQRMSHGEPLIRPGGNDVFDINGVVAYELFRKNKDKHTFYLEQSVPIDWMYPYMLPSGLIFKLNHDPLTALPPDVVAADLKYWDNYSARLLADPMFRIDDDATLTFGKLAFWHSDLYAWRKMTAEQEHFLRIAIALSPQLQDAVQTLSHLLCTQGRYPEASAIVAQAELDDPRNENYAAMLLDVDRDQSVSEQVTDLRAKMKTSPNDVGVSTQLARALALQDNDDEARDLLRHAAGATNWERPQMAELIEYFVNAAKKPELAIAFLEERVKIDPKETEMIYSLAALHASVNHNEEALKYLQQSLALPGGTNAAAAARIDIRFMSLHDDPRFRALVGETNATPGPPTLTNPAPSLPAVVRPPVPAPIPTNAPAKR